MAQYNLTADELLLVYLFFLAQREENDGLGHGELFAHWYTNGGAERLHDLFESLKNKNIINKDCKPNGPSDVEFNKTFIKGFMKHSDIHYMPTEGAVKQGAANVEDINDYLKGK